MTRFSSALSHWLHPDLSRDEDVRQRALTLATAIIALLGLLAFGLIASFIAPSTEQTSRFGYPIVLGAASLLIANLIGLKKYGCYTLSAHLTVVVPFLAIIAGICVTGGPARSPVTHLICVPIIMSFYFLSPGRAVLMNGVFIAITFTLLKMEQAGFAFTNALHAHQYHHVNLIIAVIDLSFIGILAAIYQYTSNGLRRQLRTEHQKAVELANNDLLTGIANRRRFEDELDESLRNSTINPYFSLCVVDLNDFKPINDKYGHHVGDEVIREVAQRIRDEIRKVDFVARLGGDEFVLIIRNVENHQSNPMPLLQRVLKRIEAPIETSAGCLCVSGSIGLALYPEHGTEPVSLMQAADAAMYHAKSLRGGIATHYKAVQ